MLGFKIKIQEKGGTKIQDVLSNKNLWTGEKCGREECTPCGQNLEKTQDCTVRNIVYESRCGLCNPGGETGLKNLADGRELPSIYVGETSRPLKERAGEHVSDYNKGAEDSHMLKHWSLSHKNEKPKFNQFIVGKYKTALGRQVGEAIRIQMRGNTLNSTGAYNRCRLTGLVIDSEWDRKVWEESWQSADQEQELLKRLADQDLTEREEPRKRGEKRREEDGLGRMSKRRKITADKVYVWVETVQETDGGKEEFLYGKGGGGNNMMGGKKKDEVQTVIPVSRWEVQCIIQVEGACLSAEEEQVRREVEALEGMLDLVSECEVWELVRAKCVRPA